jgi:flavorubredoxin
VDSAFSRYDLGENIYLFRGPLGPAPLTFNSYLIRDRYSALIHTGMANMWPALRSVLNEVLPVERLNYVVVPHFEADECGALREVLKDSGAEPVASATGALQLRGFGLASDIREVGDGDVLDLGEDRPLEFVAVPSEMHLWQGIIAYDRRTETLFSSDFLSQAGPDISVREEEVSLDAMARMNANNVPHPEPYRGTLDRLERLPARRVAPGHGSLITERVDELIQRYFTSDF